MFMFIFQIVTCTSTAVLHSVVQNKQEDAVIIHSVIGIICEKLYRTLQQRRRSQPLVLPVQRKGNVAIKLRKAKIPL